VTARRRSTGVNSFGFRVGRIKASFRKVKHDVLFLAAIFASWSLEKFVARERMEDLLIG
jgi:hypothetical protein